VYQIIQIIINIAKIINTGLAIKNRKIMANIRSLIFGLIQAIFSNNFLISLSTTIFSDSKNPLIFSLMYESSLFAHQVIQLSFSDQIFLFNTFPIKLFFGTQILFVRFKSFF